MKARFMLPLSALILLSLTGCAAKTPTQVNNEQLDASSFYGNWQVAGVAVADTGVQALEDDDPSLMGRRLSFTHDLLAWATPADPTEDACKGPVFSARSAVSTAEQQPQLQKLGVQQAVPYGVRCQSGRWGPLDGESPTFFLAPDGALALLWYDGGMLKLVRNER